MIKVGIILVFLALLATFLPVYNGRVLYCGINPDVPCAHDKLNLIEFVKYRTSVVIYQ